MAEYAAKLFSVLFQETPDRPKTPPSAPSCQREQEVGNPASNTVVTVVNPFSRKTD
jgi:hypothetical protein